MRAPLKQAYGALANSLTKDHHIDCSKGGVSYRHGNTYHLRVRAADLCIPVLVRIS